MSGFLQVIVVEKFGLPTQFEHTDNKWYIA